LQRGRNIMDRVFLRQFFVHGIKDKKRGETGTGRLLNSLKSFPVTEAFNKRETAYFEEETIGTLSTMKQSGGISNHLRG
jgi:hypothetical protein